MALPKQTALNDLIRRFKDLGWQGPISGGKHRFMRKGQRTVRIPNPHGTAMVHVSLLSEILRQAGISHQDWTG